jgi:hypothetical protein
MIKDDTIYCPKGHEHHCEEVDRMSTCTKDPREHFCIICWSWFTLN